MMEKRCPECDEVMEFIEPEDDVGIVGGWECDCGYTAPLEDDGEPPLGED